MSLAWQEIARFGKKLVLSGLTSSRFGNISLRREDRIFITCTGSMLDELDGEMVVEVDLSRPCNQDKIASSETCVHRAIYQSTSKYGHYSHSLSLRSSIISIGAKGSRADG